MLVDVSSGMRKTAWAVWRSTAHTPLHVSEFHDTRKSAMASAMAMHRKGWGDYFVIRRVTFGPATVLEST